MLPSLSGTHINYLLVCRRKLWLYAHRIEMEQSSDRVMMGRQLHQKSFKREEKEVMIDGQISIDFLTKKTVHDMKLTRSMEQAHRAQVLYYLWYLKRKGAGELTGMINYPKQHRSERVELTPEHENDVKAWVREAHDVIQGEMPPVIAEKMFICKKCSYCELCWG